MATRPSNWYGMSSEERREWERNQRAVEDAEYDRQRAQEDAERADRNARDAERRAKNERAAHEEQCAEWNDTIDILEAEKSVLTEERDKLAAALRAIIDKYDSSKTDCDIRLVWKDWENLAWELVEIAREAVRKTE